MYLQTSRLQYNLQGVVLLQTAFSKKINSVFTVQPLYHKYKDIATCFCDEKTTNAEIAVFLCRKLLLFGVECGIMWISDKMH